MSAAAEPGQALPDLVKHPTRRQLVKYAGASGDFYEIHYDPDFARSVGLPGVIVHGLLQAGFLAQLVTDWMGPAARLRAFEVSYRRIALPDQPYVCRGTVESRDGSLVELKIWGEDADGNQLASGSATVELGA